MSTQPNLVTVHVTQEMIDAGRRKKCLTCPIAIAVTELLADWHRASVTFGHFAVCNTKTNEFLGSEIKLPIAVTRFIHAYDNREPVNPFSFTLPRDAFLPGMLREGHECPECGLRCHCCGDIDDLIFSGSEYERLCTHCDCLVCGCFHRDCDCEIDDYDFYEDFDEDN